MRRSSALLSRNILASVILIALPLTAFLVAYYSDKVSSSSSNFVVAEQDDEIEVERSLLLQNRTREFHVLAYGDSLTAGWAPPKTKCSYAGYLQDALDDSHNETFQVDHIGIMGFTSYRLMNHAEFENGLRHEIDQLTMPPDLVILMAGTNDLRTLAQGVTLDRNNDAVAQKGAKRIFDNLLELQKMAFDIGVPQTLAVGIPPSGFQEEEPVAKLMARVVNNLMRRHGNKVPEVTYIDFPFEYVVNGTNWSHDGIHFSCDGSQAFGEFLAHTVREILVPDE